MRPAIEFPKNRRKGTESCRLYHKVESSEKRKKVNLVKVEVLVLGPGLVYAPVSFRYCCMKLQMKMSI